MILMFQLVLKHNEETRSQKNDPCIHSSLEENTPILSQSLRDILRLILQENSFSEFNDKPTAAQRWQSPLPTLLRLRFRQKY